MKPVLFLRASGAERAEFTYCRKKKYYKNMDKNETYDITEEQWKVIEPLMPPEYTGKKGRPRKDSRIMVNGMLWINRSGAQWRQLPEKYGLWQSMYARFAK